MIEIKKVDYCDVKAMLELADELGVDIEGYEGSLVDNYIIHNDRKIKVNSNTADYIIAKETYKNSWESDYTVILTDDTKVAGEYMTLFADNS